MRRNFIRVGDKTTAGGVVIEGIYNHIVEGQPISFDGAKISCPSCKSTGTLKCVPPRLQFTLENGQQAALENDLCICGCRTPPKLVAGQFMDGMEMESVPAASLGSALGASREPSAEALDEPVSAEDSGLCLDCLVKAAAAGASTVIRGD